MNRIDRLFAMLLWLQLRGKVRARDLAERFQISERTVYRDMKALSEMGVPISALAGEGYQLLDTFTLPPLALNEIEAQAAVLGLHMFIKNSSGSINQNAASVLDKIEAILPRQQRENVQALAALIDFYPLPHAFDWDDPTLLKLLEAVRTNHVVRFEYRAYRQHDQTTREVEPNGLTFHDGAWYVNGFCRLRNDTRSFRVNRLHNLAMLTEQFQPRMMVPAEPIFIEVQVRFSAELLDQVQERQHYAFTHLTTDSVMYYRVHDVREIRNWLLGFGASAEVLAPSSLRQWLREEAQRLMKLLT